MKFHRKKNYARAQAATEYLMIAGFLLVIIGIAYVYTSGVLSNSVDDSKTRTSVNNIAKAIDQVYALGPGSKISVTVDLPSNVASQLVENQLVGYVLTVNGSPSYYYADTKANLRGSLPLTQGTHEVSLTVNDAGEVVVGETGYGLFITPRSTVISLDEHPNYNQTPLFNISNMNPDTAGNISISVSGTASTFITVQSYPSTLATNTDANFGVNIHVTPSTAIGTYSAYLQVDSNNGSDRALIQIIVYPAGTVPNGSCTGTSEDTNWQTSWTIFDANVTSQYQLVGENTLHTHDTRYYTKAQSDANWNKYILINADINFSQLQNYPPACPAGQAIQDINDTNYTCITVGGGGTDTNWQTSFTTFDANLKATYPIKADVNNWGTQNYVSYTGGITMPSVSGNSGKYLTTNGTTLSWADISSTSAPTIKVKSGAQSNSTTSGADVTDLGLAIVASKDYSFHCYLNAQSAAKTTGIQLAMNGPASPTFITYTIVGWTNTTTITTTAQTAYETYQANTSSQGAVNRIYEIYGTASNGTNAGTLTPRFKSEVNASAVTIQKGSWCLYTPAGN